MNTPIPAPMPGAPGPASMPTSMLPPAPHQAPTNTKSRTSLIVGGVAVALVVAGGAGYLISSSSGGNGQVALAEAPAFDVGSPPIAPAIAGAGDVPTPVTLPAPVVSPPVTTAPVVTAPVVTAAPVTPTTAAPVAPGGGTSGTVDIGSGVIVPIPTGFGVAHENPGFVYMVGVSGEIVVEAVSGLSSIAEAISIYVSKVLPDVVSDLEFSTPESLSLPSPALIDRQAFIYRGAYVSNQGGSTPVEGLVNVIQRTDGLIIIQDFAWPGPTSDHTPSDEFIAAIDVVLLNLRYG